MIRLALLFCLIVSGCSNSEPKYSDLNNNQINSILRGFSDTDKVFTDKGISFDSIVTLAGTRSLDGVNQRVKFKLFFYDENCRGYFNIADKDDKNLQIFGKKIDNDWVYKCVTKLNLEEAGGYMFLVRENVGYGGIWSSPNVNFEKGSIQLTKQKNDYNALTSW